MGKEIGSPRRELPPAATVVNERRRDAGTRIGPNGAADRHPPTGSDRCRGRAGLGWPGGRLRGQPLFQELDGVVLCGPRRDRTEQVERPSRNGSCAAGSRHADGDDRPARARRPRGAPRDRRCLRLPLGDDHVTDCRGCPQRQPGMFRTWPSNPSTIAYALDRSGDLFVQLPADLGHPLLNVVDFRRRGRLRRCHRHFPLCVSAVWAPEHVVVYSSC